MANTRGKTSIHGPSATGNVSIVSGPKRPGVHGSGATGGAETRIGPGHAPTMTAKAPPNPDGSGANAGHKTTVAAGTKKSIVTSGKSVGSGTTPRRKKARVLGTGGTKPA